MTLNLRWGRDKEHEQVSKLRTNHNANFFRIMSTCRYKKPPKPISLTASFCLSLSLSISYLNSLVDIRFLNSFGLLFFIFGLFINWVVWTPFGLLPNATTPSSLGSFVVYHLYHHLYMYLADHPKMLPLYHILHPLECVHLEVEGLVGNIEWVMLR